MPYLHHYISPVGNLTITSDGKHITWLRLEGQKYVPSFPSPDRGRPRSPAREGVTADLPIFHDTTKRLDIYFAGENPNFNLPIKAEGTPFRKEVWKLLTKIPYGQTTTYGALAKKLAKKHWIEKMSARGIGGAVGHNPISIIVPCHRVIGANGNLTGYAGGIDKKVKLLWLESL